MSRQKSILIVEDNKITGELLQAAIEQAGDKVTLCRSGLPAIEMIKRQSFDVLVADYRMPEINGSDVVRIFRATRPQALIVGMSIEEWRVKEFVDAGGDEFLSKPFEISNLLDLIERKTIP